MKILIKKSFIDNYFFKLFFIKGNPINFSQDVKKLFLFLGKECVKKEVISQKFQRVVFYMCFWSQLHLKLEIQYRSTTRSTTIFPQYFTHLNHQSSLTRHPDNVPVNFVLSKAFISVRIPIIVLPLLSVQLDKNLLIPKLSSFQCVKRAWIQPHLGNMFCSLTTAQQVKCS